MNENRAELEKHQEDAVASLMDESRALFFGFEHNVESGEAQRPTLGTNLLLFCSPDLCLRAAEASRPPTASTIKLQRIVGRDLKNIVQHGQPVSLAYQFGLNGEVDAVDIDAKMLNLQSD